MDGGTGWRHGGEKNGRRGENGKETTENRFETRRCNRAAKLPGDILDFEKGGARRRRQFEWTLTPSRVGSGVVGSEWSRKLFTKFPDSAGCSVKMQTPRLIPRLIGVCDYCRGELCRRVWRTLFSHEQRGELRDAVRIAICRFRFPSRLYFLLFFPPRLGARVYALATAFFFVFR